MPLYVGDYLRDTRRLTTLQHGAYMLLIMDYWVNGNLPEDDQALAQVTGLSLPEWLKNKAALQRMFVSGWRHKRIDDELAKARSKASSASGSAHKRWEAERNAKLHANAYTAGVRDECLSQPQSSSPSSPEDKSEGREVDAVGGRVVKLAGGRA